MHALIFVAAAVQLIKQSGQNSRRFDKHAGKAAGTAQRFKAAFPGNGSKVARMLYVLCDSAPQQRGHTQITCTLLRTIETSQTQKPCSAVHLA